MGSPRSKRELSRIAGELTLRDAPNTIDCSNRCSNFYWMPFQNANCILRRIYRRETESFCSSAITGKSAGRHTIEKPDSERKTKILFAHADLLHERPAAHRPHIFHHRVRHNSPLQTHVR